MMKGKMQTILKVVVGSQAHGLAGPNSDYDYRGVFVVPTSELVGLGKKIDNTSWIEGQEDDTSWEIGHFLNLAVHCNPTILETFLAPLAVDQKGNGEWAVEGNYKWINGLRSLFPYVWNSKDVMNAFIGYGLNQRKKFFDDKDKRAAKYAVAYLRVLYQAEELLKTGTFTVRIADTEIGETLKKWKAMSSVEILDKHSGEVIEQCLYWEKRVREAYEKNPNKQTDIKPINDFLLEVRKEFWT
jgi:uncharacterized protein